ncbi:SRPBCC family protein [Streptomyces triticirhizae]|uniref:SRPBCC family protein n=1 Tax=Streptomyces triticirhizae TaxID=2483353 RepID=A0A3M2M9G7_9ACTN|nr:SRPBCC family protein [Streptomyces triticirhizae]RMI46434.1 SRPBCC family protein [Streptomyces triticirhizae]
MADFIDDINAVHREVGRRRIPAGDGHTVVLSRRYEATLEDVWNACTTPERLARWLAPVTGDLREGGSYQLEGNAGGKILACERPHLLRVTWVYGENVTEADVSEVTLKLSAEDYGATRLTLEHASVGDPEFWERYGPGATGIGWDLSLLGLALHLAGEPLPDKEKFHTAPEGRGFVTDVSQRWRAAHVASGAPAEAAERAAAATAAFFAPEG